MFTKILIANRGEIACRVIRTCRSLGIKTVAVFSDSDASGLHVRSADQAVHLGGSAATESYLSIPKMIAAAVRTRCQAIHPGYGFLSENGDFVDACVEAGITFIGPPANAIRLMGSKAAAKELMLQAGVPVTPGYHGEEQNPGFLLEQAQAIGYPVLIKASAGGGGKGIRLVNADQDFPLALAACKREALASFGDDRVLIERYILQPRHIEIQVFADTHGNVVSLFERDCSVQRRHQKVLEEAPAPGMTPSRRAAMGKTACDAARAVGYAGAGTVEFIADQQGNFYFMEMNTRLQVEHPVTEMITGLDLVEWQLRVAAGDRLPLKQEQIQMSGHAIEARVYAEDPENNFLPATGTLAHLRTPIQSRSVRVETGVEQGDQITSFYDPMIAKLIVWGETRAEALQHLSRALSEYQVGGIVTNLGFLKRLVRTESFQSGKLDTGLIEREKEALAPKPSAIPPEACLCVSLAVLLRERESAADSPWAIRDGWRMNGFLRRTMQLMHREKVCTVCVEYRPGDLQMDLGERSFSVSGEFGPAGELVATVDGIRMQVTAVAVHDVHYLFLNGETIVFRMLDPLASSSQDETADTAVVSPMPGVVTAVLVEPGTRVNRGTPLLVLEAMKMEYVIKAPAAGKVESFLFSVGEQAPEHTPLVRFEQDPKVEE